MSNTSRVRWYGRITIGILTAAVLSIGSPSGLIAQRLCFSNTSAQIGRLHDITDSLCLRPRALAQETGRTGYWSLLRYS